MSVTLSGVRVNKIELSMDHEGKITFSGTYELISSTGKVLAKQGFNSYNDIKISGSVETLDYIQKVQAQIVKDINTTLGLVA